MHECRCDDPSVERYLARISGLLLDRIDIHLAVPGVSYGDLAGGVPGEASAAVRARVESARARQRARLRGLPGVRTNAQMSAPAYYRVLKIARTIADIAAADEVGADQVAEAVQYRSLDQRRTVAPA